MTNYRRGLRGEKKARAWLEAKGYYVIESRGSHGVVDLVAINRDQLLEIQVKSGRQMTRAEFAAARQSLRTVPVPVNNGHRELWTWPKYSRGPVVEEVS